MLLKFASRYIIVTAFVVISLPLFGHGSKSLHADDFRSVFNGYGDRELYAFYMRFSSGIDSGLLNDIAKALEENFGCNKLHVSKGEHRYYGHSWPFGDDIPREKLAKIEKIHPGAWRVIKPVWAKFCGEQITYVMSELRLPRKQARAFCAILYYIHLLGDLDPRDNSISAFSDVMDCEDIVKNLNKQFAVLFINHPEMAAEIRQRIEQAKMAGPNKGQKALAIMQALRDLKVGTKMHMTWGQYFEKSHPWSGEAAYVPAKAA